MCPFFLYGRNDFYQDGGDYLVSEQTMVATYNVKRHQTREGKINIFTAVKT
jgi:hypothetical protein